MPPGLLLKSVHAEGFRGIRQPVDVECGRRATLLFARNGQGKSSLLGAVEWCLFGALQFQSAENRTFDELVNIHGDRALVRLELEGSDGPLVVERSRVIRKLATKLLVTAPAGETLEDEAAEAFLFRALGLSFADFYRAVFLHQESVRGLLIDEPRVRDEALDRLFGLEKLRDVLAAIPVSVVKEAVAEIQTKRQRATDKLSGAAAQAEQTRAMHLREALEAGFDEKDLTLAAGRRIVEGIRRSLEEACAQDGTELPALPELNETEDLEKTARKVKEITKNKRLAGSKDSPVDRATTRLIAIQQLKKRLDAAQRDQEGAEKAAAEHRERFGEPETLESRRAEIQERIKNLERERDLLGLEDRVFADAIAYLKAVPSSTCPVCEQGIDPDRVLDSLESRVASEQRVKSERIGRDIQAAKRDLEAVGEAENEARRLERNRRKAEQNLLKVAEEAEPIIGESMPAELAMRLENDERRVLESLEDLKKAQERTERMLQAIDADVDRLRLVHKFLKADEQFALIRETSQSESDAGAAAALEEDLERLLELEQSLNRIIEAVNKVSRERAISAIEACRDGISRYYSRLCDHPYFDGIRIDVEDRSVKGVQKNSYTIRAFSSADGRDTLASSRLSVGQMNCVALSLHLALREVLTHNLGFIILDDPGQCLDLSHKEALVKSLGEIAEGSQILVATEDQDMERMLIEELKGPDTRAYSLHWSPGKGTVVSAAAERA